MVVDLSIETIKANKETGRFVEDLHDYTVFLDNHRILTVSTSSVKMATKWLKSVLKSLTNNTSGEIFVGVSVDRRSKTLPCSDPGDSPYDLLQLCTGCRCLLYKLHHRNSQFLSPKNFNLFLKNPRVFCFLIGSRLFEMVQSQSPSASSSRSGIKKRTKTRSSEKTAREEGVDPLEGEIWEPSLTDIDHSLHLLSWSTSLEGSDYHEEFIKVSTGVSEAGICLLGDNSM